MSAARSRLLFFSAFSALLWAPVLIGGRAPFYDTLFKLFHPNAVFFRESIRSGHLPFWNPYLLSGVPFLANLQSAVFYPPTWLSAVLSFPAYLAATFWLHTVLAGVFMTGLARREGLTPAGALAAGVAYGANGWFLNHYAYPSNFHSYVWLPLIFSLGRPGAAIALAVQFFAGHPQFVWYTVLAMGIRAACSEKKGRAFMDIAWIGFFSLAISAVQLIPSIDFALQSRRAAALGIEWATAMSLHPVDALVMFLGPQWNLYFIPQSGDPHIVAFYFGWPLLLLAGLGLARGGKPWRVYAWIALVGLLLALGRYLPGYSILLNVVPPLSWFRLPSQALFLTCFGLAMLAGRGLDAIRASEDAKRALILVCMLDLWLFSRRALITIEPSFYEARTPAVDYLAEHQGDSRLFMTPKSQAEHRRPGRTELEAWLHFLDSVVPNVAMAKGLYDVYGYEEMRFKRYDEVLDELAKDPDSPWMDMLGIKHILSFYPLPSKRYKQVASFTTRIYENPHAYPKAYTALPLAPSRKLEGEPLVSTYEANRVVVQLPWRAKGMLVLTDAWDHGWSATVDGVAAPVRLVNRVQRGVDLPEGARNVEFRYRPRGFVFGALLSLLALAVCLGASRFLLR